MFTRARFDSLPPETFNAFLVIYRSLRCRIHGYGAVGYDRPTARRMLLDLAREVDYVAYIDSK